ncbi:MAG: nitrilase-related carbon-nitrogen hydrolase [bacterium]
MQGRREVFRVVLVFGVFLGLVRALPADDFTTVLVQFSVDSVDYRSLAAFHDRVEEMVIEPKEQHAADFVVFPEYVSTFGLFADVIDGNGELEMENIPPGVVEILSGSDSDPPEDRLGEVREFVASAARRRSGRILSIWRSVARQHGVWILAGSGFVPAPETQGVHNRLWVIDDEGRVAYEQDKVFLTEYESEILGVVPGEVEQARPFTVEDVEFSVTICRDSYFEAWEALFGDVDVWIDVRANGEFWDESVRRRFDTALPERIARTDVDVGLSTSLNGRFLDLFWQGPAFIVGPDGERVRQSPTVDGDYLMEVEHGGS